jgi:quercetin dioxygenase-like cupin family protein
MRLHNLYADADGESHFRDIEIELSETMFGVGLLSKPQPVSTVMFRQVPPGIILGQHNAPRRMYAVVLEGHAEFTASDGETRVLGAGEVLLVEDTTGKGHQSKSLDGPPFRAIFVTID